MTEITEGFVQKVALAENEETGIVTTGEQMSMSKSYKDEWEGREN